MKTTDLLKKPLFQLTTEEFLSLNKQQVKKPEHPIQETRDNSNKYVYGIMGIAKLFGCSKSTASRLKNSKKIDAAITQIGRKIIVDAELALKLCKDQNGKKNSL